MPLETAVLDYPKIIFSSGAVLAHGALGAPSKGIIGTPGCLPLQPGPTNTQSVDCCVGTQADQHPPGRLPFQPGPVSTSGVDCSCMITQAMLHQIPTTPLAGLAAKGGGGLCTLCLRGSPCAQDGVGTTLSQTSNSQGVNDNRCSPGSPSNLLIFEPAF